MNRWVVSINVYIPVVILVGTSLLDLLNVLYLLYITLTIDLQEISIKYIGSPLLYSHCILYPSINLENIQILSLLKNEMETKAQISLLYLLRF